MKTLLAVDASPQSKHAVQMEKHLAAPVQLSVLYVVDVPSLKHAYLSSECSEKDFEGYRQEVARLAQHVLHDTRDELLSCVREIQLIADNGDPAESIIQTAEEHNADVILLGHRGMTPSSTFLLGGVSQKVATYAPCSVLICKGAVPVLDRILLAVDGSDASKEAAQFLGKLPFKGPLHLMIEMVWDPPPSSLLASVAHSSFVSPKASLAKSKGETFLREVAEPFQHGPYKVDIEWRCGDPPLAILESAKQHDVQMIVMGARGVKGIKRFLLGSVSQKILTHAPCSVLIVR
jgi:nucleotide-binding universal stress UspA family protein